MISVEGLTSIIFSFVGFSLPVVTVSLDCDVCVQVETGRFGIGIAVTVYLGYSCHGFRDLQCHFAICDKLFGT